MGLERMSLTDRQGLLKLAAHGIAPTAHPMCDIADLLSEDEGVLVTLQAEGGQRQWARQALPPRGAFSRPTLVCCAGESGQTAGFASAVAASAWWGACCSPWLRCRRTGPS